MYSSSFAFQLFTLGFDSVNILHNHDIFIKKNKFNIGTILLTEQVLISIILKKTAPVFFLWYLLSDPGSRPVYQVAFNHYIQISSVCDNSSVFPCFS